MLCKEGKGTRPLSRARASRRSARSRGQGTLRPMAARSRRNVGAPKAGMHSIACLRSGCNGQGKEQASNLCFGSFLKFFCLFYPQAKFLTHLSETVAPLHHFHFKSFIIKVLCVVQRWVQEGATGCNGGETERPIFRVAPRPKRKDWQGIMPEWCSGAPL